MRLARAGRRKSAFEITRIGTKRALRASGRLAYYLRCDLILRSAPEKNVRFAVDNSDATGSPTHSPTKDAASEGKIIRPPIVPSLQLQPSTTGKTGESSTGSSLQQQTTAGTADGAAGRAGGRAPDGATVSGAAASSGDGDDSQPTGEGPSTPQRAPPAEGGSPQPRSSGKKLAKKSRPFWEIQEERRLQQAAEDARLADDPSLLDC